MHPSDPIPAATKTVAGSSRSDGPSQTRRLDSDESDGARRDRDRDAARSGLGEPHTIGRFIIVRLLGEGGMGRVFAAYDEQLDRRVAIKVLHREVGDRARRRVDREARAMARLTHPNVVQVYEVGSEDGQLFIAMEFVQGTTLAKWQRDDKRPWPRVLEAYRQAGEALVAAHRAGIVHRDFKPHNAMVEIDDRGSMRVRVLDFGLARSSDHVTEDESLDLELDRGDRRLDRTRLTSTGVVMGTPAYMAPEQFSRNDVDEAADQFAFCVALWEALYGQRPFDGQTLSELAEAVTGGRVTEPPRASSVPGWIRAILDRGLAVRSTDRWPSMQALLEALGRDPSARRRRWLAVGLGVLAVGMVVGGARAWLTARAARCDGAQQQLAGLWDASQRAQIEAQMLATELSYASKAWAVASSELGDYVERWAAMHHETCAATTIRGEQSPEVMDLRMACLHKARQGLRATVHVLADADADVVQRVQPIVGGLDDLARCADVQGLLASVDPPRPEDAAVVEDARARLAEARAERDAFRYDRAHAAVEQARALLDSLDYPPVLAEAALERGYVCQVQGDAPAAEVAYREAAGWAAESGLTEILHRALMRLMYVVGHEQGRSAEALQFRELVLGLSRGLDDHARAWSRSTLGAVLDARGEHRDAEREHRRALELWVKAKGPTHSRTLMSRDQLGHALAMQGKFAEAEREHRAALAIRIETFGEEHPVVGTSRVNLGTALLARGDLRKAEAQFRQAIAIARASLGPQHSAVPHWRFELGRALAAQRRYDEAATEFQAALDLFVSTLGPDHPGVAESRRALARAVAAGSDLEARESNTAPEP